MFDMEGNEGSAYFKVLPQWRTEEGGGGVGVQTPPQNSEGPPKLCQTQPDCENC